MMDPRSPISVGVIGVGTIGRLQIDLLSQSDAPNLRVIAAASPDACPMNSNIAIVQDYRDLLMRDDIDAVTINTPPNSHYNIALDALIAGKDLLVEKPPALNIQQCVRMMGLADRRGQVLFMAFHARYHESIKAMRRRLAEQEITRLEMTYRENVPNYHDPHKWIFDPGIAGGGVLMDSGINAISVVTSMLRCGLTYRVERAALVFSTDRPVETAADVEFTVGSRGRGHLKMDWFHERPEQRIIEIATAAGHNYRLNLVSDELQKDGAVVGSGGTVQQTRIDQYSEYKALYEDFADHITNRSSSASKTERLMRNAV
jgi:D-galactose 1-dehydrogenase